ncbi:MAG: hypothetical protein AAFP19_15370, partial [Bacteroidota bacterium]
MRLLTLRLFYAILLGWGLSCVGTASLLANVVAISYTNPDELQVCSKDTFFVQITNISGLSLTGLQAQIDLPDGASYELGNFSPASLSDVGSTPESVQLSLPNLSAGEVLQIQILISADCAMYQAINAGQVFQNTIRISQLGTSLLSLNTSPYTVLTPLLILTDISPQNSVAFQGDTITRTIEIQNTRLGSLRQFYFDNNSSQGAQIIDVSPGTILLNTDSTYSILLQDTDFQAIGNGDIIFDHNERITITERIIISDCSNVFSEYAVTWGCNSGICQSDTDFANAVVDPDLYAPDLQFTAQTTLDACYCGDTPSPQQLTLINEGNAEALNLRISIINIDSISGIDPSSFTGTINGNTTAFSIDNTILLDQVDLLSCLSPVASLESVDLVFPTIAVGDTLQLNWEMYYCIPYCNELFSGWMYNYTYERSCPVDQVVNGILSQSSNVHSVDHQLSGGTSIWDSSSINLSYQIESELLQYDSGQLLLSFSHDPLMEWAGNNSDFNLTGGLSPNNINIDPGNQLVELIYDLPLNADLEDIDLLFNVFCTQPVNSPLEGRQVRADARLFLGNSCSDGPNCGINLCPVQENLSVRCNYQGNPVGDFCITNYRLERSNFGLPDNNDDRIPDGFGSINENLIRKDRAVTGDTLHETIPLVMGNLSQSGLTEGYITSNINNSNNPYNNVWLVSPVGIEHQRSRIRIWDQSTGNSYSCEGLLPVTDHRENGNLDTLIHFYNISVGNLNALACGLPSGFEYASSDSIILENTYVVRQGRYYPADRVDEIFALPDASISNVAGEAAFNSCVPTEESLEITGFVLSIDLPSDFSICDFSDRQITLSQQISGGHNFFPFEYRHFGLWEEGRFLFENAISSAGTARPLEFSNLFYTTTYT